MVLAAAGDRILDGVAAASQRLADALRIQRGTYPFARDYGSTVGAIVDRRPAAVFAAVAEAMSAAPNALDDVDLQSVRVVSVAAGAIEVEVDAAWRPEPTAAPTPITVRARLATP